MTSIAAAFLPASSIPYANSEAVRSPQAGDGRFSISPDGQRAHLDTAALQIQVDKAGGRIEWSVKDPSTMELLSHGRSTGEAGEPDGAGVSRPARSAVQPLAFDTAGAMRLLLDDGRGTELVFQRSDGHGTALHAGGRMPGGNSRFWVGNPADGFAGVDNINASKALRSLSWPASRGRRPGHADNGLFDDPVGMTSGQDDVPDVHLSHVPSEIVMTREQVTQGGVDGVYQAFTDAGCHFPAHDSYQPWQEPDFWRKTARGFNLPGVSAGPAFPGSWGIHHFVPGLPSSAPFLAMPSPGRVPAGFSPVIYVRSQLLAMQRAFAAVRALQSGAYSELVFELPTFAGGHCVFRFAICVNDCPHRHVCRSAGYRTHAMPCQVKKTSRPLRTA